MGSIKLEAGKYYRTRDGRKAFVLGVNPFDRYPDIYPFNGFIEGEKVDSLRWWNADGAFGDESRLDLVAEWVEPKHIKGFSNIYRITDAGYGGYIVNNVIHPTREAARKAVCDRVVACIEIDVLEGQGLGDAS